MCRKEKAIARERRNVKFNRMGWDTQMIEKNTSMEIILATHNESSMQKRSELYKKEWLCKEDVVKALREFSDPQESGSLADEIEGKL